MTDVIPELRVPVIARKLMLAAAAAARSPSPSGLRLRGIARVRRVPWDDIQQFAIDRRADGGGSADVQPVVILTNGKRIRFPRILSAGSANSADGARIMQLVADLNARIAR